MMDRIEPAVPQRNRFDNIDLMETIAMLFVIVYHLSGPLPWFSSKPPAPGTPPASFINYLIMPLLSTCVPLFFFANGFLLFNRPFDLKKHMLRCLRTFVLTMVWACLTLLLLMPIEGEWLSPREFLSAIWLWKPGWLNHLWFMRALIGVYLLFPLMKTAFDHNRKVFYCWVAICVALVYGKSLLTMGLTSANFYVFHGHDHASFTFFDSFNPLSGSYPHAFSFFVLGGLAGDRLPAVKSALREKKYLRPPVLIALSVTATLCLSAWGMFVSSHTGKTWDTVWFGYDSVSTLINVLVIFLLTVNYKYSPGSPVSKYIRLVSANTIGIYFTHMIFVHLVDRFVQPKPFALGIPIDFFLGFCIMTLCMGITVLMKKIPLLKKLV